MEYKSELFCQLQKLVDYLLPKTQAHQALRLPRESNICQSCKSSASPRPRSARNQTNVNVMHLLVASPKDSNVYRNTSTRTILLVTTRTLEMVSLVLSFQVNFLLGSLTALSPSDKCTTRLKRTSPRMAIALTPLTSSRSFSGAISTSSGL